jgi:crossover junction endodeoxyribonuclease RusA
MWKHAGGKHYLTAKAKGYYHEVAWCVREQGKLVNLDMPLKVQCWLFPPDKRRRDMDNAWKVVADSLTKARVWQDDSLIKSLNLEWGEVQKGGLIRVLIQPHVEKTVS